MFSWFGVQKVTAKNKLGKRTKTFHPSLNMALNHMEAILIESFEPFLNKQSGRFGDNVKEYYQFVRDSMSFEDKVDIIFKNYKKGLSSQKK